MIVREHLRATQDRQKFWIDLDMRPLEFEAGDQVFFDDISN